MYDPSPSRPKRKKPSHFDRLWDFCRDFSLFSIANGHVFARPLCSEKFACNTRSRPRFGTPISAICCFIQIQEGKDCRQLPKMERKVDAVNNHASWWEQWLQQPQRLKLHHLLFQLHFWIGSIASMYMMLMSITGSVIVYRNELSRWSSIEWLVRLHTNLLSGSVGRFVNGIGGGSLTLLSLTGAIIWWPGVKYWRRSLQVNWRANFPRINWDLHSAFGFWCFPFVFLWGISGLYFAFPHLFSILLALDPSDRFTDQGLFWLSALHFGRFNWFTEALWALLGLVPGALAFTGTFICCCRATSPGRWHPWRCFCKIGRTTLLNVTDSEEPNIPLTAAARKKVNREARRRTTKCSFG